MNQTRKNISIWIIIVLLFLNSFIWAIAYDLNKSQALEIIFFDIGQGDAIFIETPENHQVLIDGGSTNAVLDKLGKEMGFWDRTIDLVILTHPEHDHVAGLLGVLQRYKVDNILWTGVLRDTAEHGRWRQLIEKEEANIFIAELGQKIITPKTEMTVLNPTNNLNNTTQRNTNNTSVVVRLVFGQNSFIFTGDVYKAIEESIADMNTALNSDVLKVGHHGSKTSTSQKLLAAVSPDIAVISAGKDNRYGHPDPGVLDILDKYDIKVLRTDELGDIKILSDGKEITVK
jgi:competence protein ComEC